jgi:hypothetical protein
MKFKFMMYSNIFLALPVVFAALYSEWVYCFFALGILVFSPLYHWYKIKNPDSFLFKVFKNLDWMFAISAFLYMYFYVYQNIDAEKNEFYLLLTSLIAFFWYGWKKKEYDKWHPWFHVAAPIVSSAILIFSN